MKTFKPLYRKYFILFVETSKKKSLFIQNFFFLPFQLFCKSFTKTFYEPDKNFDHIERWELSRFPFFHPICIALNNLPSTRVLEYVYRNSLRSGLEHYAKQEMFSAPKLTKHIFFFVVTLLCHFKRHWFLKTNSGVD